ncbi:Rossmann-fold NAD(P)-binding domain-containing protein [Riemerella columbipharyngis]|uniref:hypothetical protein n=1 Tax=Riemerella columbipharyngis TaxID=1071918 RepID=UPI0015A030AC|nr:hypothetical protein [Riemerella columbipharyngis]
MDIFIRRKVSLEHPKLRMHIVDFEKPKQWKSLVKNNMLFSYLGTILKAVESKEAQ